MLKTLIYVAAIIAVAAALLWGVTALAQHTHEGEVGAFYQSWLRPAMRNANGERYSSCCNNQDCRPILQMRKNGNGVSYPGPLPSQWEVLIAVPWNRSPEWVPVADLVWEDNQRDPRESPDERGHACVTYSGYVICAVRASGQ